jgi:hypothetical protein
MSAYNPVRMLVAAPLFAGLLLIAPGLGAAQSDDSVAEPGTQSAITAPPQRPIAPSDATAGGDTQFVQLAPLTNPQPAEPSAQSASQAAGSTSAESSTGASPAAAKAQPHVMPAGSANAPSIQTDRASTPEDAAARKPGLIKRGKAALVRLHEKISEKISAATERLFSRAEETFPSFCSEWEHKLHDRETNNLRSIKWREEGGWKIGRYLGYGKVKTCACKHSSHGLPVGSLSYIETTYDLAGKTPDEALHAPPKAVDATETTELFRWAKTHWAY